MTCVFVVVIYLAIWNLRIYLSGGQDESQDRISHLYALYFSHCGNNACIVCPQLKQHECLESYETYA